LKEIGVTTDETVKFDLIAIGAAFKLGHTVARLVNDQISVEATITLRTEIDLQGDLTSGY